MWHLISKVFSSLVLTQTHVQSRFVSYSLSKVADLSLGRLFEQASSYMHLHQHNHFTGSDDSVVEGKGATITTEARSVQIGKGELRGGKHWQGANTTVKAVTTSDTVCANKKPRGTHAAAGQCCVIDRCFDILSLLSLRKIIGMVKTAACFPICILSFKVPYLLLSLHVTTSTAIRAVDDNQSAW